MNLLFTSASLVFKNAVQYFFCSYKNQSRPFQSGWLLFVYSIEKDKHSPTELVDQSLSHPLFGYQLNQNFEFVRRIVQPIKTKSRINSIGMFRCYNEITFRTEHDSFIHYVGEITIRLFRVRLTAVEIFFYREYFHENDYFLYSFLI